MTGHHSIVAVLYIYLKCCYFRDISEGIDYTLFNKYLEKIAFDCTVFHDFTRSEIINRQGNESTFFPTSKRIAYLFTHR